MCGVLRRLCGCRQRVARVPAVLRGRAYKHARFLATFPARPTRTQELLAECLRCCAEESKQEETTFTSAVLEVCPHSLRCGGGCAPFAGPTAGRALPPTPPPGCTLTPCRGYPHIETFVNKHASEFPALRVKCVQALCAGLGGQGCKRREWLVWAAWCRPLPRSPPVLPLVAIEF